MTGYSGLPPHHEDWYHYEVARFLGCTNCVQPIDRPWWYVRWRLRRRARRLWSYA